MKIFLNQIQQYTSGKFCTAYSGKKLLWKVLMWLIRR